MTAADLCPSGCRHQFPGALSPSGQRKRRRREERGHLPNEAITAKLSSMTVSLSDRRLMAGGDNLLPACLFACGCGHVCRVFQLVFILSELRSFPHTTLLKRPENAAVLSFLPLCH